jgi:glycosyltransferase involved in cell wall biosynthesis
MASRILLHCLHGHGGLAEHAHYQARAFSRRGDDILVLCPDDYLQGRPVEYRVARTYRSLRATNKPTGRLGRLFSAVRKGGDYLCAQWKLAWHIIRFRPDFVLLDSYMEYLSPLWVWPHLLIAKLGFTRYAANLHDPVRDFVVGPAWWHKLSVALAYAPLKVAVVHQSLSDSSVVPTHVRVVEAPVGVYDLTETAVDPEKVRSGWGTPLGAPVFLSFGFIRDNKNIDLLIRALHEVPESYLVVVGSAQSSTNKPLSYYRNLAARLGVSDRVTFREEFVPDESLAGYFAASDFVVMTYNSKFRSQSGVLNIAARARRPVLASGGESPLKSCVQKFALGEFVEPDSLSALSEGMKKLCRNLRGEETARHPDWHGYSAYASWDSNVKIISGAFHAAPVDLAP